MDKISEHISYEEATKSQTATRLGIDNTPNELQLSLMKSVASACFEPIREWYRKPIIISSFYRSEALNKAIGGVATSQHCLGKAIDIDTGSRLENEKIFEWAKLNLKYDQLINEYDFSWVHISFDLGNNRNETLMIK